MFAATLVLTPGNGLSSPAGEAMLVDVGTPESRAFFPTGHAAGLRADNGLEVLVHLGIDTARLNGQGFTRPVAQGDRVTAGQPLIRVDLAGIRERVPGLVTPVVFTNLAPGQRGRWRAGRSGWWRRSRVPRCSPGPRLRR